MAEKTERMTPPYVSFTTFTNLLDTLKEAMPPQIDSTVLSNYSGATQSQIKVALRFLGLLASDDTVLEQLRTLVKARGTEDWQSTWSDIFFEAYSGVVANVDIDNGTLAQLQAAFSAAGCESQQVREKAIRFYLSGLDAANCTYSRFFAQRGTRTASRKKGTNSKKAQRKKITPRQDRDDGDDVVPEGYITHPFLLRPDVTLKLTLPADITHADVERLYRWMKSLPMEMED